MILTDETICAISTAPGMGAIAIVRVAGPEAISIVDSLFHSPSAGKSLASQHGGTFHFGSFVDGDELIDDVVALVYRAPHSFTGEDMIEISCHGSTVIQQRIMQALISRGVRSAGPGEFTRRAFANGKMDLSQAEAVADIIASQSEAARRVAIRQLKGCLCRELRELREILLQFCTLLELELDFSEEDVEFADRAQLIELINRITNFVQRLANSFRSGNAIKNGIPVAIAGPTNAGKSTLLNTLLGEERAIVSNVHGTTRDSIEDTAVYRDLTFRFIDTAGLRQTTDEVERIGIQRSYDKIQKASVVLAVVDASALSSHSDVASQLSDVVSHVNANDQKLIVVLNKADVASSDMLNLPQSLLDSLHASACVAISALQKSGVEALLDKVIEVADIDLNTNQTVVNNLRHYEALVRASEALGRVHTGITTNLSGELVSMDIHDVIDELASITGEVSSQDVLNNIFANFCIGK